MNDINVQEITLEKLIELWNKGCQYELSIDNYDRRGDDEYPVYSIKMSDNVSVVISNEDKYVIRLVFSGYLTYKKFELSKEQFQQMEGAHERAISEKQKKLNENAVKRGEYELSVLLQAEASSGQIA